MAYAMKRRRNAGQPKSRSRNVKTRASSMFKKGQKTASRMIDGRKMRGSQADIRKEIHRLIREDGTKTEIDLLTGPAGKDTDAYQFRQGVASEAANVAGFNPGRSGGSRAAISVDEEYDRDEEDDARSFDSASARALSLAAEYRTEGEGMSSSEALKKAWAKVKGEGARANPRRRRNGTKKGMMRKTSRRAFESNPRNFGAEFLFI